MNINQARLLLGITFFTVQSSLAGTVETARDLESGRFKGWTYGSKASEKQIDCVQYVLAVVEEELKQTLVSSLRKAILIDHGWTASETQEHAETGTDKRLAGVQYALTELSDFGSKVEASQAQPGDIIQYWMKKGDGTWFGHSGIVVKVEGDYATLINASAAANRITETSDPINLKGSNRLIYIVRLKSQ